MTPLLRIILIALLAMAPAVIYGHSAKAETTLERILKEKKLRVVIDVANPPFGILDEKGEPDVRTSRWRARWPRTWASTSNSCRSRPTGRIPALLAGRADVTIASISVTAERAKTVMYCNPDGVLQIVVYGPKNKVITKPEDLGAMRVGITMATLEEATVPKILPKGTNIVWFDQIASMGASPALRSG